MRLRAQAGAFRAPARVPFFFCKKKGTKENHLDLRSKDPLARCGSCRFGGMHSRMKCGGGRCRFGGSLVPLAPLPLTAVRVGAGALIVFGDYQIAPIAARSTAMGRWRLTPPGVWGRRLRAGRGTRDTSSVSFAATCLPAGRSVRGSDRPPACHSIPRTPQGEGFFRPGALLLALFISFWWRRSGPSGTGATGRRRGLRRGRRSWGPRWAAPRAGRSSSRRFGVFPPTWPADAGDASPAY